MRHVRTVSNGYKLHQRKGRMKPANTPYPLLRQVKRTHENKNEGGYDLCARIIMISGTLVILYINWGNYKKMGSESSLK